MAKTKRTEAKLLSYTLFYDKTGKLVTERTTTDITSLEKFLSKEEYNTLNTVIREATGKLDSVHSYIENYLSARVMTER
jgi:hypothetical protein